MTSSTLTTELLWGFVIGALSVCTLSVTAERFGSKLAGVLGGFPSTVAASLFFLARSSSAQRAAEAASVVPMMMGFFGVLLGIYCILVHRSVIIAVAVALGVWGVLTAAPLAFGAPSFAASLLTFFALFAALYYTIEVRLSLSSRKGGKVPLRVSQILMRALSGGSVVALSIYLGALSGPLLGGIMAAFPAVTIATLLVTYQAGGAPLSAAVGKSMMISGMLNVTAYASAVYLTYPVFGEHVGTLLGLGAVALSGVSTMLLVHHRMA